MFNMKLKSKLLCCVLLFAVCCMISSCSRESVKQFNANRDDYKAVISVSFEDEDDVERFEKRLEAMNVEILSYDSKDDAIEYHLLSHYDFSTGEWEMLGEKFEASILDENDELMIQRQDVEKVQFDGIYLNVYVDASFFENHSKEIYYSSIKIDDRIYDTYLYIPETDEGKYIEFSEKEDMPKTELRKCAIAFASEPMNAEVTITVIESTQKLNIIEKTFRLVE